MASSSVADKAEGNFIDRRAAERYDLNLKAFLLFNNERYPILIKDVSVYGLGVSMENSGLSEDLTPKQDVFIEWGPEGETIHAMVVWSFKGRCGFVLKPALTAEHPLILKGKAIKEEHI